MVIHTPVPANIAPHQLSIVSGEHRQSSLKSSQLQSAGPSSAPPHSYLAAAWEGQSADADYRTLEKVHAGESPGKATPSEPFVSRDLGETSDAEVRYQLTENLASMLHGLTFENARRVVGVAPRVAGLCVETAAGLGGGAGNFACVPQRGVGRGVMPVAIDHRRDVTTTNDEEYARTIQKEENEMAARNRNDGGR